MRRIIRPAAYAWIVEGESVLLCRLCEDHNRGLWTLPGGGLDFGEGPVPGCHREVWEETGLEVEIGDILLVDSTCSEINPLSAQGEYRRLYGLDVPAESAQMQSIRIVYLATVTGGSLRDETDGTTDHAKWIPIHQVPNLTSADLTQTALDAWMARQESKHPQSS